jgi:hypothetical protein
MKPTERGQAKEEDNAEIYNSGLCFKPFWKHRRLVVQGIPGGEFDFSLKQELQEYCFSWF